MTLVSLTDCCHLLAIDPKTLRRWMSLSHISAQPHPTDARLKCVMREQVLQLATIHRRILPDFVQPQISALATPTHVLSTPVLPDFSPYVADLTKQLGSLQAQVAALQHQLTWLHSQLQKEQQWQASQAGTLSDTLGEASSNKSLQSCQEKSLESSQDKSLESCQEKSLESSQDKSLQSCQEKESAHAEASTSRIDRRKLPHVLPLVEYGAQGRYVVISPGQGLLAFEPDSSEWFAWLSTLSSFRFVGASGHLTVHRKGCNPRWSWRASRSIHSRSQSLHLARTEFLTVAMLEQAAASLQSRLN